MSTIKQKRVAKALVENLSKPTPDLLTDVLVNAGYGKGVAKTPDRVIESVGVQKELERLMPDEALADIHAKLLRKQEVIVSKDDGIQFTGQPHSDVKGALDMAYKLKGAYAAEKHETKSLNVNVNVDPRAEEIARKYEDELNQSLMK